MWFIIENSDILKVSVSQENDNQIFIENCPDNILGNPSGYKYMEGEFILVPDENVVMN